MLTESQLDGSAYWELWQKQGDQRASPLIMERFPPGAERDTAKARSAALAHGSRSLLHHHLWE